MSTTGNDGDGSQWLPGDSDTGPASYRAAMEARNARGSNYVDSRAKVRSIWRRSADKAEGKSFCGFYFDGDRLVDRERHYVPLNGVSAVLEQGMSRTRSTATRVVGGAMLAGGVGALLGGAIKKNNSQVYVTLTIPGRDPISLSAPAAEEPQARDFVARVNAAAAKAQPPQTP